MAGPAFDLAALLRPVELESFLGEYLDQKPLVLQRRSPEHYRDFPTLRDVDLILSQHQLAGTIVVTKKDGSPVPIVNETGFVDTSALYRSFAADGTSIIINAFDCHSLQVAWLCRSLQRALQRPAGCNLYLTPKQAQGFDAHFDTHDVLVLQLAGTKRWKIYAPVVELPLDGANVEVGLSPRHGASPEALARLGAPLHDVEIEPGDLLYVPRGYVHEARTSADVSMHLTISISHDRWLDVVTEAALAHAARNLSLRRALPPAIHGSADARERARREFRTLLGELAESDAFERALGRLEERFIARLTPIADGHLTVVGDLDRLALETIVCHRPGTIARVFERGEQASIEFPGGQLTAPRKALAALRFIAETPEFEVRAVNGLTDAGRLVLVRRLVSLGLLTVKNS